MLLNNICQEDLPILTLPPLSDIFQHVEREIQMARFTKEKTPLVFSFYVS
jgi:hypothetical protein